MDNSCTIKRRIEKLKWEEEYYRQIDCKGDLTKCGKSRYWSDIMTELKTLENVWDRLQGI